MRTALIETLIDLAREDERIFLITADLGWSVVEKFAEKYPDRFQNVGVAEANMAGVATGLAQAGFVPFIYSIATFTSMRCYEQIRNGPLLHQLPVRVVGIGGGFAYGHAGPTHYALEDLAIARAQPGMTVLIPADPAQTRSVIRSTMSLKGPAYLRIGKGGNPPVPALEGRFSFGKPEVVKEGNSLLLLACGGIVHEALAAATILEKDGLVPAVAIAAHIPPNVTPELTALLRGFKTVVSIEEGYAAGGLGSWVAETIAQEGLSCRLRICGVKEPFAGVSGSQNYMLAKHGLNAAGIAQAARSLVNSR
jgi:transketolase